MNIRRVILAGLLMTTMAPAQHGTAMTERMNEKIDAILAPIADASSPGLAVLVKESGRTIFAHGYGIRDLRTKERIDARTNFRLASCTKQFTAMAVMLLVRDGKLRYETKLTEVFPEFPAYGKTITIRHLLNHTSSLPDYEDLMEAEEKTRGPLWSPEKQIQDAEVLELLERETRGKFPAGTNWSYSNSGYVVLGLIVAKISGKPFGEFLRERIFEPLKMADTVAYQKGKNEVANRAFGHTKERGAFRQTDQSPTSATLGDGGIYSSLEDLSRWDEALRGHTLLSAAEMKPALEAAKFENDAHAVLPDDAPESLRGAPVRYGFGWFLNPYKGHARMWHYGDTMGFKTTIQRFAGGDLTVIVLCNRTDLDPEKLAFQIADILFSAKN